MNQSDELTIKIREIADRIFTTNYLSTEEFRELLYAIAAGIDKALYK